jgi:hypothetical protein
MNDMRRRKRLFFRPFDFSLDLFYYERGAILITVLFLLLAIIVHSLQKLF